CPDGSLRRRERLAEPAGLQPHLPYAPLVWLDAERRAVAPRADDVLERSPLEVERHAVLDREAGLLRALDESVVLAPAGRLLVVMDAVGVRKQAEPADGARRAVEGAEALLEPAQRAGRWAAHDDSAAPCPPQHGVEAVGSPRAEHADEVAPADVDQI